MKVVFDTHIFISALVIPGSRAEEAMRRVMEGKARLIISKPILQELLTILSRKFSRDREELARVAVYLAEIARTVHPKQKINMLKDEPDDRVLECALTGQADIVVTGDRAMLALGEYKGVKIVTLKDYLNLP